MTEPKPCDLLVTGDLILTLDAEGRILKGGAIAVAGRTIVDLGPPDALCATWLPAQTIDGRNRLVIPGLVNVHNHTPLMITRGMIEDIGFAPMYTPGIPQGHWLNEDDAYALSCLGMYELLRAGCTTRDSDRSPSPSCSRRVRARTYRAATEHRHRPLSASAPAECPACTSAQNRCPRSCRG